jgi:ATP-dependent Lon protease
MTGEITLRGKVLPVGGIREKVLAAHRAGIRTVILPHRNERDLEDVPAELRQQLEIVLVESVEDVLNRALATAPAETAPRPDGVAASPRSSVSPGESATGREA